MVRKSGKGGDTQSNTEPKFPYTTKPSSLRRLLKEIPKKPRPAKFDKSLLKGWGFGDSNDLTMLRVLKAVGLLTEKNEPTELYAQFMSINGGARYIAPNITRIYGPMFQASHTPYNESHDTLKNLFNINSGGGEKTLEFQIQTFKALCENASFEAIDSSKNGSIQPGINPPGLPGYTPPSGSGAPILNINLHIHLPENKTRRDYEAIIEDIGRHIFGRSSSSTSDV